MRLLEVWDQAQAAPSVPDRSLALLGLVSSREPLDALPVGAANGLLLDVYERLFGSRLVCLSNCPACNESLEMEFLVGDIRVAEAPPSGALTAEVAGRRVQFRLPTWVDLAALAVERGPRPAARRLLDRCLLDTEDADSVADEALADELLAVVAAAMEAADQQAETRIGVTCARCAASFEARFDVVPYLWAEIDAHAQRLLVEVHTLARAYGWREADILSLSPARRGAYLEMATSG